MYNNEVLRFSLLFILKNSFYFINKFKKSILVKYDTLKNTHFFIKIDTSVVQFTFDIVNTLCSNILFIIYKRLTTIGYSRNYKRLRNSLKTRHNGMSRLTKI